jgi:hypothetical protein
MVLEGLTWGVAAVFGYAVLVGCGCGSLAGADMKLRYRNIERFKYEVAEDWSIQTAIKGCACRTEFIVLDDDGLLTAKKGYKWDGASGPTVDTWSSMCGSCGHDEIYELIRRRLLEYHWRAYADQFLHDICTRDGMIPIRADIWKDMVEAFAVDCARPGTQPEDEILEAGKE